MFYTICFFTSIYRSMQYAKKTIAPGFVKSECRLWTSSLSIVPRFQGCSHPGSRILAVRIVRYCERLRLLNRRFFHISGLGCPVSSEEAVLGLRVT